MTFLKNSQIVQNVFAVAATHPLTSADATAIKDTVEAWITSTLQAVQSTDVRYMSLTVRDPNPNGPRYDFAGDNTLGIDNSGPLPNEVTFALKKASALSGRKFRGRFYHIGVTAGMLSPSDKNILTATAVFALVSTYEALKTALATAGFPMQIIQRNYTTDPPSLQSMVPVLSILATDSVVDSQRRRGPGRGR